MKKTISYLSLFAVLITWSTSLYGQSIPHLFRYQSVARNPSGAIIASQPIDVRIGIISGTATGVLEWEELHSVTTNTEGLYVLFIGAGTSTGSGVSASFSSIDWPGAMHYMKVEIDFTGSSYIDFGTRQFFSVPYAFYSESSSLIADRSLSEMVDVDTAGLQIGSLLKWDGSNWKSGIDNLGDTVLFAWSSGTAANVDTASYAFNLLNPLTDTVIFAYGSDSSQYSSNAGYSSTANTSTYSDTADYAFNFLPYNWSITGNVLGSGRYLGTNASEDLVFKTNNVERLRIAANGNLGAGIAPSFVSTHFSGIDGLTARGNFGAGILADTSYNTRLMWYPAKASIRIGEVVSNRWSNALIGNYTLAAGYNTQASGIYSIAMGYNSVALNENCISLGRACYTDISGVISNGGSVAMGDSCRVFVTRSVAMGYQNRSDGGIVMGYRNRVYWASQTSCWGAKNFVAGDCSIGLGTNITTSGVSCFVFADSSTSVFAANLNYQFKVRASGGVIFYADPTLSSGVQLFPGSGAWASISDRNKKENFIKEDPEAILQKISKIKITSWNYRSQNRKILHVGPMAQDFYDAFGVGEDRTMICTTDMDGVSLLGIKALYSRVLHLSETFDDVNKLKTELKTISDFSDLEERINKLEKEF